MIIAGASAPATADGHRDERATATTDDSRRSPDDRARRRVPSIADGAVGSGPIATGSVTGTVEIVRREPRALRSTGLLLGLAATVVAGLGLFGLAVIGDRTVLRQPSVVLAIGAIAVAVIARAAVVAYGVGRPGRAGGEPRSGPGPDHRAGHGPVRAIRTVRRLAGSPSTVEIRTFTVVDATGRIHRCRMTGRLRGPEPARGDLVEVWGQRSGDDVVRVREVVAVDGGTTRAVPGVRTVLAALADSAGVAALVLVCLSAFA